MTSCTAHIDTSVYYPWLLLFLPQRQVWPRPEIRTTRVTTTSTSGITIETTVTTITGTIAKIARTGATWRQTTGRILSSTEQTPECTEITGIGATVIRTAIEVEWVLTGQWS